MHVNGTGHWLYAFIYFGYLCILSAEFISIKMMKMYEYSVGGHKSTDEIESE